MLITPGSQRVKLHCDTLFYTLHNPYTVANIFYFFEEASRI